MSYSIGVASLDKEGKEGKDASDEDDYDDGLYYEENQDASTHVEEHWKTEKTEPELRFALGDVAVNTGHPQLGRQNRHYYADG